MIHYYYISYKKLLTVDNYDDMYTPLDDVAPSSSGDDLHMSVSFDNKINDTSLSCYEFEQLICTDDTPECETMLSSCNFVTDDTLSYHISLHESQVTDLSE